MVHLQKLPGFLAALAGSIGMIACGAFPKMMWQAWRLRAPERGAEMRRTLADTVNVWAERILRFACRCLDMTVDVRVASEHVERCIIIANHRSTLDVFFVLFALRRHGVRNVRWVAKKEAASFPIIGWMCKKTGGIFVGRNRDPRDIETIRAGAGRAADDGASVLIFPEGTRQQAAAAGFRHLGAPKLRGFAVLHEALPAYPVLRLHIRRHGRAADGRTMFQTAAFTGEHVTIDARVVAPSEIDAEPDWLLAEWRRMDAAALTASDAGPILAGRRSK